MLQRPLHQLSQAQIVGRLSPEPQVSGTSWQVDRSDADT
jgi:hypothetical protein